MLFATHSYCDTKHIRFTRDPEVLFATHKIWCDTKIKLTMPPVSHDEERKEVVEVELDAFVEPKMWIPCHENETR